MTTHIDAAPHAAAPRAVLALLAGGLLLVLAAWLQFGSAGRTIVDGALRGDAADYVAYAYNLREHGLYSRALTWWGDAPAAPVPDTVRSPGYPLFLAALIDGRPDEAFLRRAVMVQAALGVAIVLLTFATALRMMPLPWAVLAGALAAISPHLVAASTFMLSETLFAFLLIACLYCVVTALQRSAPLRWMIAAGILLGLAVLVRPVVLLLPLAFLALPWLARGPAAIPRSAAFAAVIAAALVVAPWLVRNATVAVPADSPSLLVNFIHHGSYPDLMYDGRAETYGYPYSHDPASAARGASVGAALSAIVDDLREAPGRTVRWFVLGKPLTLLSWGLTEGNGEWFVYPVVKSPYLDDPAFRLSAVLMRWLHWPLVLLAIAMPWLLRSARHPLDAAQRAGLWCLYAVAAYVVAAHVAGAPFPRYAVPFRPVLYVLAAAAVWLAWPDGTDEDERPAGDA